MAALDAPRHARRGGREVSVVADGRVEDPERARARLCSASVLAGDRGRPGADVAIGNAGQDGLLDSFRHIDGDAGDRARVLASFHGRVTVPQAGSPDSLSADSP